MQFIGQKVSPDMDCLCFSMIYVGICILIEKGSSDWYIIYFMMMVKSILLSSDQHKNSYPSDISSNYCLVRHNGSQGKINK